MIIKKDIKLLCELFIIDKNMIILYFLLKLFSIQK